MRRSLRSCGIAIASLLLVAWCATPSPREPRALRADPPIEVPVAGEPVRLVSTTEGLALVLRRDKRAIVLHTSDEAVSWQERDSWSRWPRSLQFDPECGGFHRIEHEDGAVVHVVQVSRSGGATEPMRSRIERVPPGMRYSRMAFGATGEVGLLWIDDAAGWHELRFRKSEDHGLTWSAPVTIDPRPRGKEIFPPALTWTGGRWVVAWADNRDPETLFDTYVATSKNGRSWSEGARVNDDEARAWNRRPELATDGRSLFVSMKDFREKNRFGDYDANIYLAGVDLRSLRVLSNARVNDDPTAVQQDARLAVDPESGLLVAVWLDARFRMAMDVALSWSADGGRSWAPARRVNHLVQPPGVFPPLVVARPGGEFWIAWRHRDIDQRPFLRRFRPAAEGDDPGASWAEVADRRVAGPLLSPSSPETPVSDNDFDDGVLRDWRPMVGRWIVNDGALLGFDIIGGYVQWDGGDLEDFVLEGRFRLDPRNHVHASILFRGEASSADRSAISTYRLTNSFRTGVGLTEGVVRIGSADPHSQFASKRNVLQDRFYSFRQGTWYDFRLVVQGRQLDYYVNGEWVLSSDGLTEGRRGFLALGFAPTAPVEYDDLRVYDLSSSSSSRSAKSSGFVRK